MTYSSPINFVAIVTCLFIGCGKDAVNTPATVPALNIDSEELAREINKQMAEQFDKRAVDLEKGKLILLVDGIRDREHSDQIQESVETLLDKGLGNWQVMTKGGFKNCMNMEVSPIADLEAAAAKISFGAVLGLDVEQRTMVVDANASATPRPDSGWPGADAIRGWKGRKLADGFMKDAKTSFEKLAAEDAMIVGYPQRSHDDDAWASSIDTQLGELASTLKAEVSILYSYFYEEDYRIATVGPVANPDDIVKALGDQILWKDESQRVIVLKRPADKSDTPEASTSQEPTQP